MNSKEFSTASEPIDMISKTDTKLAVGALTAVAGTLVTAAQDTPQPRTDPRVLLIGKLTSTNDVERLEGLQMAENMDLRVLLPLATTMDDKDKDIACRAKRAMQRLLRVAGKPGSNERRQEAEGRLSSVLLKNYLSIQTKRELIWMISEIATPSSIPTLVELLAEKNLREDVRCALTRMPYPEALVALKQAFANADQEFKYALAESLRLRGEKVEGYESRKLKPMAQTTVKAPEPKK